jgi:nucleoside-diphosphate-sugar epimerase
MRVLVTGAGGFSGAAIACHLVAQGHAVVACVGSSRGRLPENVAIEELISGDLAAGLPLPADIDAIVHAAARSPAPGVSDDDMRRSNIRGTEALLQSAAVRRAQIFIYLSSLSIYGAIDKPLVDESTPIGQQDTYGSSKWIGEQMLAIGKHGFRSLAIRLPGVIGRDSVRNWLTTVLSSAKTGQDITIFNANASFNNAAHVSDLADFVCTLLKTDWQGHDAVTIGAAGQTTVRRAVEMIVAGFGGRSRVHVDSTPRSGFLVSSARACERYGYAPMQIEAMLERFVSENRGT